MESSDVKIQCWNQKCKNFNVTSWWKLYLLLSDVNQIFVMETLSASSCWKLYLLLRDGNFICFFVMETLSARCWKFDLLSDDKTKFRPRWLSIPLLPELQGPDTYKLKGQPCNLRKYLTSIFSLISYSPVPNQI